MHQIDPVSAIVTVLALLFSPALADVVGPYAVIVLGAAIGGGWALSEREPGTRVEGLRYFMLNIGMALLLTVGFAELANRYLGMDTINWLLAPIAMLIGGVGHRWPAIGAWVVDGLRRFVDRRIDDGGSHGR